MTKQEIFEYFFTNNTSLTSKGILIVMLAGLLIATIIYITYWISYKGISYNRNFNISLIILLLISTVIMLMISSNVVISLGMVGALSIVRFRTAIKDAKDTIFIFWAITEGLCIGSQNFMLSIITTLFITLVIIIFNYIPHFFNKYLLIITGEKEEIDIESLTKKINSYSKTSKLKTINKDNHHQEIIFEIKVKGELDLNIINNLLDIKGIKSTNFVSVSGETVG